MVQAGRNRRNRKLRVIAVLNQKGGSGKTTIAINLAHALRQQGKEVLIVDADPQGSARDWSESSVDGVCPVVGLDRETLSRDLPAVTESYDQVVIDGPPQLAGISAAAVQVADAVLIPVQPSPYDVWSCADLVDILEARRTVTDGLPHAAFVVIRAITNTKLSIEVSEALTGYGLPVLDARTTQRVAYPTTAAREIEAIRDEVEAMLNGTER
ncbi:MAG: AAA family ATPase [Dehalococcoidia bacterium]|nr:AAA family ATPase [Dehalococcoidia bacterium]